MDTARKKLLLEEYKNRRPEMGIISYRCRATGESFLGISIDTKASFNSINAKLFYNYHPNKRLLELWNQYGKNGFELSVIRTLKYEDAQKDHSLELEELREQCLLKDPKARRIWL